MAEVRPRQYYNLKKCMRERITLSSRNL